MHEPFWHYTDAQGAEHGPVAADTLRDALRQGRTGPASQFWREGMAGWVDAATAARELGVGIDAPGEATVPGAGAPPDPYAMPRAALGDDRAPGVAGEVVPAGFWRRFAAMFLDGLVLLVPLVALVFALGLVAGATGASSDWLEGPLVVLVYVVMFAVRGLYFGAMHSSAGQATLGKRALGIKVTDEHGGRLSFARGMGRWFAAALSYLTVYLGFLMAGVTERKRALHDLVAGTQVVDRWAYTDHPERQQRRLSGCLVAAIALLGVGLLVVPILAAISVAQFQDYSIRAQVAEGPAMADAVKAVVAEHRANTGRFPASNAEAGLSPADEISGTYVGSVAVTDGGRIVVTYSARGVDGEDHEERVANAAIAGAQLLFTPLAKADGIEWQCSSPVLKQKWCPTACTCR